MGKKLIGIATVLVVAAAGFGASWLMFGQGKPPESSTPTASQPAPQGFNKTQHDINEPGGLWWIVNKQRPLPKGYEPADLTTPKIKLRWAPIAESMQVSASITPSLEAMYQAMVAAGFDVMLISGYRSEKTQAELYNGYVSKSGQAEADRLSARPGTSEHQTGLVVDLGRADGKCELDQCLGDLPEGKWLAEHAHEYGFIIRYPQGKEATVGYMYEPWHLRYVGKELAAELHAKQQTMEEFFGL
ncbi:MAG TPA: M15 family metallopeptidase [Candidatus Saccharimonadales bacterium]|nr:M15 family metallopeptidase [Candidatus Saccharimonadales bacterium]